MELHILLLLTTFIAAGYCWLFYNAEDKIKKITKERRNLEVENTILKSKVANLERRRVYKRKTL